MNVMYRVYGASMIAKVGGLGGLLKSVGPFSLASPHTGSMWYPAIGKLGESVKIGEQRTLLFSSSDFASHIESPSDRRRITA